MLSPCEEDRFGFVDVVERNKSLETNAHFFLSPCAYHMSRQSRQTATRTADPKQDNFMATPSSIEHLSQLPPQWTEYYSDEAEAPYYYNSETGETTWDRPGLTHVSLPSPSPTSSSEPPKVEDVVSSVTQSTYGIISPRVSVVQKESSSSVPDTSARTVAAFGVTTTGAHNYQNAFTEDSSSQYNHMTSSAPRVLNEQQSDRSGKLTESPHALSPKLPSASPNFRDADLNHTTAATGSYFFDSSEAPAVTSGSSQNDDRSPNTAARAHDQLISHSQDREVAEATPQVENYYYPEHQRGNQDQHAIQGHSQPPVQEFDKTQAIEGSAAINMLSAPTGSGQNTVESPKQPTTTPSGLSEDARLERIEAKLDLLLRHFNISV
ncbi:WW/Rsp5/WWP [Nannochloropsis gaditana]|uniref:WW/Rsp5/WWP n=1 Tax=Nannochloropsis gaditana TaxID=72520 RepID=W7TGT7_9STRA|nr:WW/Rsp5/WWP [Nannochloropsis gaditana]EWM26236.1 WW/Rsp5/WWP [Nannochloropsis gaditana]